ncbi:MAG: thioesterase family protein [Methanosphaera sp.]|nr:thioesterase family protein [Ruminococcus sp.]MCD7781581.1 thioesterase family protein [Methanosphaera sp.]MCD7799725.1 thioesterase family protein [Ruminococcus sp.]
MDIEIGTKATYKVMVDKSNTAKTMGSGSLDVFATPSMVAIMEKASTMALERYLDNGATTVGTALDITHVSATPIGLEVYATAEVITVNNRKITLKVQAFDEVGLIGEGTHTRFIVFAEKFQNKADSKLLKNS